MAASLRLTTVSRRCEGGRARTAAECGGRRVAAATDAETQIAGLQRHVDVQREMYVDL